MKRLFQLICISSLLVSFKAYPMKRACAFLGLLGANCIAHRVVGPTWAPEEHGRCANLWHRANRFLGEAIGSVTSRFATVVATVPQVAIVYNPMSISSI